MTPRNKTRDHRIAEEVIQNGFYLEVTTPETGLTGTMDILTGIIQWHPASAKMTSEAIQ